MGLFVGFLAKKLCFSLFLIGLRSSFALENSNISRISFLHFKIAQFLDYVLDHTNTQQFDR